MPDLQIHEFCVPLREHHLETILRVAYVVAEYIIGDRISGIIRAMTIVLRFLRNGVRAERVVQLGISAFASML